MLQAGRWGFVPRTRPGVLHSRLEFEGEILEELVDGAFVYIEQDGMHVVSDKEVRLNTAKNDVGLLVRLRIRELCVNHKLPLVAGYGVSRYDIVVYGNLRHLFRPT